MNTTPRYRVKLSPKTLLRAQEEITHWLVENPDGSIPLGGKLENSELACALVNLGIAKHLPDTNSIALKSADKARQWLASLTG